MKDVLEEILSNPSFPEGGAWKRRWYKSGDKIIEKGEVGSSLFWIEVGVVRVFGDVELDGNIKVNPGLCDIGPEGMFGEFCLFGSHLRTTSVGALTEARILEIRSDMLSVYLDDHPILGYLFLKSLFELMVRRLELANERIDNLLVWGIKAHDIDRYL